MPSVPLSQVKAFLNKQDARDDDEVLDTLERAEAILARRVGPLSSVTVTDEVHDGGTLLLLHVRPVQSVQSVNGSSWSGAVAPSGVLRGDFQNASSVRVSYTAGWTAPLPPDLEAAVLEMTAHLWRSQRVPGATRAATFGQQSEQDVQVGQGFLLPYRVQTLIEPYLQSSVIA